MRTHKGIEITRNLSGNGRSQSSQLAEPLLFILGLCNKSENGACELISTGEKRIVEPSPIILVEKKKPTERVDHPGHV